MMSQIDVRGGSSDGLATSNALRSMLSYLKICEESLHDCKTGSDDEIIGSKG